jgi:hypothetical protein
MWPAASQGWSDVMYGLQNAAHPVVGALFFVVLVIFGSFFALNLLLAVLANSFEETKGQELKDIEEEVGPSAVHHSQIEALSILFTPLRV